MPLRIVERQTGVVVLHESAQRGGDGGTELAQVQFRHHRVVHVEQETQAVALAPQLLLGDLGLLGV